ncbi:Cytochrome b reductase 1 [Sarcoptes scabiei]|nr:Cytochrome b reductase 1 [Sarcoptes scabiei]
MSHKQKIRANPQEMIVNQIQQQQPIVGGRTVSYESDLSKQWKTIYPQYINSNLTIERGRRLAKTKCVSDPLSEEIYNVMAAHSQYFEVQLNFNKFYCREIDKENFKTRGYIKYRLLDNERFKNKKEVLIFVASLIPNLKSRQNPKPNVQENNNSATNSNKTINANQQTNSGGGKKKNRRK